MAKRPNVISADAARSKHVVPRADELTRGYPRDLTLYYRCRRCGDLVASVPNGNVGCSCDNIFIDVDAFRLALETPGSIEYVDALPRKR